MKRQLALIICICIAGNAFGQLNTWRWQNPSFQGSTLTGVQMLSLTKVVACGERGTFIKTTDGGITWDVKNLLLDDSLNFNGIYFLDENIGMVCGEGGRIFKTTDGGNSWTKLLSMTTSPLRGIVIMDMNTAITVGDGGTILISSDGGGTWNQSSLETSADYTSIRMLSPDFISITGKNGLLYKSVDSGSNWIRINLNSDTIIIGNDIYGQVFYNEKHAIIVGDLGGIFSTTDGGITWTIESVGSVYAARLKSIDGKDPFALLYTAVGDLGSIFKTSNNGISWDRVNIGTTDSLNSISYYDRLNGFAVGKSGLIISTTDGGGTWKYMPTKPVTDPFYGIAFPKGDTSLGIAVGSNGSIMRTTNGGTHWDVIPSGTTLNISSVAFLTPTELCAAGQNGLVLRSHDAGLNWEQKSSGTIKYLRCLSFPTPNFGWAAGDSGIVISTIDGGSNWMIHPFIKKRYFTAVAFGDSLHGYLGCEHGVYISSDAGMTWAQPDDATFYLRCTGIAAPSPAIVSFTYWPCQIILDPNIPGLMLSFAGIMTSHDGGKNWINTEFNKLPNGIFFSDDLHGTAVGYYLVLHQLTGFIMHSSDGGLSWTQQDSHTTESLNAVCFGTKNAGTAVGGNGNIIRITTNE